MFNINYISYTVVTINKVFSEARHSEARHENNTICITLNKFRFQKKKILHRTSLAKMRLKTNPTNNKSLLIGHTKIMLQRLNLTCTD